MKGIWNAYPYMDNNRGVIPLMVNNEWEVEMNRQLTEAGCPYYEAGGQVVNIIYDEIEHCIETGKEIPGYFPS